MPENRSGNTRLLLRVWAMPLVMIVLMVLIVSRSGTAAGPWWPWLAYPAFVAGLVWVRRTLARRAVNRHLQENAPEAAIEYTRKAFSRTRVPHAELLLASSIASYRAFYGQFGRALDELDQQVWRDAPGLYRAGMLQVRALIHYLSGDDAAAGLRFAREAEELARVPAITPGARASRRCAATYIDIGRVLSEGASDALATALARRAAQASSPSERVVTLWGAGTAYAQLGRAAESQAAFERARQIAPHCTLLHAASPAPRAGESAGGDHARPALAREAEHGMCALHPDVAAAARCVRCGSFACAACARGVSERASICGACHARYRELREQHVRHESRVRAAGLFVQIVAVFAPIGVGLLIWPLFRRDPTFMLGGIAYVTVISLGVWLFGRSVRRLDLGSRNRLTGLAVMLAAVIPLGTAASGYLLWLNYGSIGKLIHSQDYARAVAATPEIAPRSPWPFALVVACALLFNIGLLALASRH